MRVAAFGPTRTSAVASCVSTLMKAVGGHRRRASAHAMISHSEDAYLAAVLVYS
jgi:hypothetical protein